MASQMKKLLLPGIAALSVLYASAAHTREWQGNMPKPVGKLPPYPPVVCVIPNWTLEPCESRQPPPAHNTDHFEFECDVSVTVNMDGDMPPQITKVGKQTRQDFEWKYGGLFLDKRRCTLRSKWVTGDKPKTELYNEPGGSLPDHISRWEAPAASGNDVEIRGQCNSGCTLVMGYVPREKICFDGFARLGFHSARRGEEPDLQTTTWMLNKYPQDIRMWLRDKGAPEKMTVNDMWELPAT